jgi:hypothetical protein
MFDFRREVMKGTNRPERSVDFFILVGKIVSIAPEPSVTAFRTSTVSPMQLESLN